MQRNTFRNHIKSNPNQIVFTMHRLIWNSKRRLSVCCFKSRKQDGNRPIISTAFSSPFSYISLSSSTFRDAPSTSFQASLPSVSCCHRSESFSFPPRQNSWPSSLSLSKPGKTGIYIHIHIYIYIFATKFQYVLSERLRLSA